MSSSASAAAALALPRLTLSISSSSSSIHRNLRLPLLFPFLSSSSPSSSLKSKTVPPPSLSLSLSLSPCPRLFFCSSSSSSSSPILTPSSSSAVSLLHDDQPNSNSVDGDEIQNQTEEHQEGEEIDVSQQQKQQQLLLPSLPSPTLSVKEKKELASYAHSLGKNKKLKSQQVGKSGVTPSVATSFLETLESNELLKLKIHGSCPGELIDVIKQLEEATGSVAVDQIGRSVILYRPSPSKMKKREAASLRKPKEYPAFRVQKKAQAPRAYSEGRRQLSSS